MGDDEYRVLILDMRGLKVFFLLRTLSGYTILIPFIFEFYPTKLHRDYRNFVEKNIAGSMYVKITL